MQISINLTENSTDNITLALEHIISQLNAGYTSGIGWTLTNAEVEEPA